MNFSPIRLKTVPLAVAVMLTGLASAAFAGPLTVGNITLDATYTLGGGGQVDGMLDTSSNIYTTANGADYYLFKSNGGPNNVFFHTYGFTGATTYFGARASGEGVFTGETRATYSNTFKNGSNTAQFYNFSFMVDQGEIGIAGSGSAIADLLLSIRKNDTTVVAQDSTRVEQDAAGNVTCIDNDFGLANASGNYMSCNAFTPGSAYGNGGLFTVSMGLIGAGETFTLDYDIIATVSGNLSASSGIEYYACGGYGNVEVDVGNNGDGNDRPLVLAATESDPDKEICSFQTSFPGSAIARSGDPFDGPLFGNQNVSADPFDPIAQAGFRVAPATVPEPGSMALIGLGLAGVAIARRKKAGTA